MRPRFRTLAALLALLASLASFAEQAWASDCAPAAAELTTSSTTDVDPHAGHGAPPAPRPHDGGPACPQQAAAPGCVLLSLPPSVTGEMAPAERPRNVAPAWAHPSPELLLVSSFFRPPQR